MMRLDPGDRRAIYAGLDRHGPRRVRVGDVDGERNWKLAQRQRPVRTFGCAH